MKGCGESSANVLEVSMNSANVLLSRTNVRGIGKEKEAFAPFLEDHHASQKVGTEDPPFCIKFDG